jgi:hypothetical protein
MLFSFHNKREKIIVIFVLQAPTNTSTSFDFLFLARFLPVSSLTEAFFKVYFVIVQRV